MNPTLTWLTFLAAATVLRFGPGALMSLLDWLTRPIADVGPEGETAATQVESAAAQRRRAALTGHDLGCQCPPCLTLAWGEAFGAECEAEMRQLDRRGATGEVA